MFVKFDQAFIRDFQVSGKTLYTYGCIVQKFINFLYIDAKQVFRIFTRKVQTTTFAKLNNTKMKLDFKDCCTSIGLKRPLCTTLKSYSIHLGMNEAKMKMKSTVNYSLKLWRNDTSWEKKPMWVTVKLEQLTVLNWGSELR